MKKYLILAGVSIISVIPILIFIFEQPKNDFNEHEKTSDKTISENIVSIVMSSSRPGCEKSNCYLPTKISITSGQTITWINHDRGFHTVTTGYYDTPNGVIESPQISPEDNFSFTFYNTGEFHYYCRLHPWMEGIVQVN
ncbi:MAG: plastocyanin/azurin family copper-binding protein [Candidatus Nitrosotenuis sp.]